MNILQEALVALLSGLTTKTGNEIHWEVEYSNGQRHGKSIGCCQNGIIRWETEYKNGIEIR